jgi:hypothetical protein
MGMSAIDTSTRDVMQVCRNGHVITDLLHALPEQARSHCDRCGAVTLDRCLTCGHELEGAHYLPGSQPVGMNRPPQFCPACGAAFPWARRRAGASGLDVLTVLEKLLRRLPRVVRELRVRHGERPALRVDDEHDLEDLLRALLQLSFDDVRLESRLPHYAVTPRTDFRIAASRLILTVKKAGPALRAPELGSQLLEDIGHYQGRADCRQLVACVYDPKRLLVDPVSLETQWAALADELPVRVVIAS